MYVGILLILKIRDTLCFISKNIFFIILLFSISSSILSSAQPPSVPLPPNILPIAVAGADQTVYVQEIVFYNASGSYDLDGEIILYGWDFGDNRSTSGISTSHVYSSAGNYTVVLRLRDNNGRFASDNLTVTVLPLPTLEEFEVLEPSISALILSRLEPNLVSDIIVDLSVNASSNIISEFNEGFSREVLFSAVHSIDVAFSLEFNDVFSGVASARIDVQAIYGNANAKWMQIDSVTLEPGETYRIMSKHKSPGRWKLRVKFADDVWNSLGDYVLHVDPSRTWADTPWLEIGPIPSGVTRIQIMALVEGSGTYLFDDFFLERIDSGGFTPVDLPNPDFENIVEHSALNWSTGFFEPIFKYNRLANISKIFFVLDDDVSTSFLFNLLHWYRTELVESMIIVSNSSSAMVINNAILSDVNSTAIILEKIGIPHLLELFQEMRNLEYYESLSNLFNVMNIETLQAVSEQWISSQDLVNFSRLLNYLTMERLNDIFSVFSVEEQADAFRYFNSSSRSSLSTGLLPLPDLIIEDIVIEKINGIGYNISIRVLNQGRMPSNVSSTELVIDGQRERDWLFPSIPVNQSRGISFLWKPAMTKKYVLHVNLDVGMNSLEVAKTNNQLDVHYDVFLPDLTLTFQESPTKLTHKEPYLLQGEIMNRGSGESESFKLSIIASGVTTEAEWITSVVGEVEIESIQSGSHQDFEMVWIPDKPGEYTLEATVDGPNIILEEDEDNNYLETSITVLKRENPYQFILNLVIAGIFFVALYFFVKKILF